MDSKTTSVCSFHVLNELGMDVLMTWHYTDSVYIVRVVPVPEALLEVLKDKTSAIIRETVSPGDGQGEPRLFHFVRHNGALTVDINPDGAPHGDPTQIEKVVNCVFEGAGFLVKMTTVTEVGDRLPTLLLSRGPRIFRIASELPYPVQLAARLERDCYRVSLDADPRLPQPHFGAERQAALELLSAEDENGQTLYSNRIAPIDDEGSYIIEPHGYLTVTLVDDALPAWQDPKELLEFIKAEMSDELPDLDLGLHCPEDMDFLTSVLLLPVTSSHAN